MVRKRKERDASPPGSHETATTMVRKREERDPSPPGSPSLRQGGLVYVGPKLWCHKSEEEQEEWRQKKRDGCKQDNFEPGAAIDLEEEEWFNDRKERMERMLLGEIVDKVHLYTFDTDRPFSYFDVDFQWRSERMIKQGLVDMDQYIFEPGLKEEEMASYRKHIPRIAAFLHRFYRTLPERVCRYDGEVIYQEDIDEVRAFERLIQLSLTGRWPKCGNPHWGYFFGNKSYRFQEGIDTDDPADYPQDPEVLSDA
jgi:hypothetical protein